MTLRSPFTGRNGDERNVGPRGRRRRNVAIVSASVGVVLGMGTLSFYSVPLYRLFSQATGYGGTTQIATASPSQSIGRTMTLRFDTNVAPDMPWKFIAPAPVQVRLGEQKTVSYVAENPGDEPILGTATYNVTPFKAGQYFDNVQCFCFNERVLMPGEKKTLTVTFFVDPKIAKDPNADDVTTITLSFTYFNVSGAFFNKGTAGRGQYTREEETAINRSAEVQK